jgi:hypothetical protein
MKETAELLKRLAARHRHVAQGLRNEEVKAFLLHLAQDCDEKAQELERRVAEDGANTAARLGPREET